MLNLVCAMDGKKQKVDHGPPGVRSLGWFRTVSMGAVQQILDRVREQPSMLQEGPQGYKAQTRRSFPSSDISVFALLLRLFTFLG